MNKIAFAAVLVPDRGNIHTIYLAHYKQRGALVGVVTGPYHHATAAGVVGLPWAGGFAVHHGVPDKPDDAYSREFPTLTECTTDCESILGQAVRNGLVPSYWTHVLDTDQAVRVVFYVDRTIAPTVSRNPQP